MPLRDDQATILIRGTDGDHGDPAVTGLDGKNNPDDPTNPTGRDGTNGKSTIKGCVCAKPGTAGANAVSAGGPGDHGKGGGKAPSFTITSDVYIGNIVILSRGGKGGDGSPGGQGGSGDHGGKAGINSSWCLGLGTCKYQSGGNGGNAADGGLGGDAGAGGDGGTITVFYKSVYPQALIAQSPGGKAGEPGAGGLPGTPGKGGANEPYGKDPVTYAPDGHSATQPRSGRGNDPGKPGAVTFTQIQTFLGGGQPADSNAAVSTDTSAT